MNLLPWAACMGTGELTGSAGSAPLPGDMGALTLLPRVHPGTHGPAHPCSQCNSSAWHELCCEPVLVGPSCPLSHLSMDGHFYWASGHLGEEHKGEGSLLPIKAYPVAKVTALCKCVQGDGDTDRTMPWSLEGKAAGKHPCEKTGTHLLVSVTSPPVPNSGNVCQRNARLSLGGLGIWSPW